MVTTLQNLVLKTATVGNVTLPTPADRIGSLAVADAHPPADSLSQGQFFMPQLPTPEPYPWSRQEVSAMRYMPNAAMPTGPVGSVSGPSADRLSFAPTAKPATPACHPWSHGSPSRLGRDCQSPDRDADRRDRRAEAWRSATATARMTAAVTAAAK